MKAERKTESAFVPVILTLESQAEVDAVFSLLNHARICDAVELPDEAGGVLEPFHSQYYHALHTNLDRLTSPKK